MEIGDFVTVIYYLPETSKFGYLFRAYYGKVVSESDDLIIDFEIYGEIINGKLTIKKTGTQKMADRNMVYQINEPFGLSKLNDYKGWAEYNYQQLKSLKQ